MYVTGSKQRLLQVSTAILSLCAGQYGGGAGCLGMPETECEQPEHHQMPCPVCSSMYSRGTLFYVTESPHALNNQY